VGSCRGGFAEGARRAGRGGADGAGGRVREGRGEGAGAGLPGSGRGVESAPGGPQVRPHAPRGEHCARRVLRRRPDPGGGLSGRARPPAPGPRGEAEGALESEHPIKSTARGYENS